MESKEPTASQLKTVWSTIDAIYCITLSDRADRRDSASRQFERVGLAGRVQFFLADRHATNCEQGIFESHQACLQMGLNAGARTILIFEDDILFGPINVPRLARALNALQQDRTADILFLGCIANGSRTTATPGVRRIRYQCLTHAYMVTANLARTLATTPWQQIPYDTMLKQKLTDALAIYPSIAFQSNAASDNDRQRTIDRIRRVFGGLRFIQTINEHYHRFRLAIIGAHLLLFAAMVVWIVTR